IADTAIPTGPVRKPKTRLNNPTDLPTEPAAPPAFPAAPPNNPKPFVIGARNFKSEPNPDDTLAIIPPTVPKPTSNGPIARANAPMPNITFLPESLRLLNHPITVLTPLTIVPASSLIFSPVSVAQLFSPSDSLNTSKNSARLFLPSLNSPSSRLSPIMPMFERMFFVIPSQVSE